MKMRNGFASERAIVDHDAETFGKVEFLRHRTCREKEMSKDGFIARGSLRQTRDQLFRHDQQVHGRLRLDVMKDDTLVVLVFDPGGDFAIDDFLENGFGHGGKEVSDPTERSR